MKHLLGIENLSRDEILGQPIEILTRSAIWQMRLWLKVRSGDLDSIKDSFLTTVRSSQRTLDAGGGAHRTPRAHDFSLQRSRQNVA